jgi:cytochrome P450
MDKGFLTFHRSPERHACFLTGATCPIFDPVTKAWIIADPGCCERLLASPHTRPATYSDDYVVLEKRLGIDFSNVLLAFLHIPMCLHEEEHRKARRRVAEHLAARKFDLSACLTESLTVHLKALRQEGEVEIVRQVLEPLILSVTEPLTDVPPAVAADCRTVSTIFDKSIGPRKRQRVDAELGRMRAAIVSKLGSNVSEDAVGLRLALVILGRDTLLGTLGESLYSILSANQGRRLNEISYPQIPPETGVPYIERIAVKPFCDQETQFNTGDRLRIYVQAFAYSGSPRDRAQIFGVGSHLCLGKALSLDLWQGITSALSKIPLYADIVSHALRTDDYVFLCPSHLSVRLHS